MLFADGPPMTANDLGNWIGICAWIVGGLLAGAAAVMGIIVGIKKLREPAPVGSEHVTRSEFEKLETAISYCVQKTDFEALKLTLTQFATKSEVAELKALVRESETHVASRIHDLANTMASIPARVEALTKYSDKFDTRLGTMNDSVVRVVAVLESKMPDLRRRERETE